MRLLEKLKRIERCHNRLIVYWFPWYWHGGETARLRRSVARLEWSKAGAAGAKAYLLFRAILWPLLALFVIGLVWCRYAAPAMRVSGRSVSRQLVELFCFAYWYGHAPIEYYERMLYHECLAEVMPEFLAQHECKVIASALNGASVEVIKSKRLFAEFCHANGLRAVPTLLHSGAEADGGGFDADTLPKVDLFLKPEEGQKGIGIERWDYSATEQAWTFQDRQLPPQCFTEYLRELAGREEYIVQAALENHADVARFSLGGLVTFRVITVCDGLSPPEVIGAYAAFPRGRTTTNHEIYGGMVAKLDVATGRLHVAYSDTPQIEAHRTHPDTRYPIEGATIQSHGELLDLAVAVHACFPDVFSVGWDLVRAPEGFFILEGNTFWGLHPGLFLGRTPYVAKARERLRGSIVNV